MSDAPTFLYQQVADALRDRIEGGEWAPGAKLPTESQLVDEFEVNRLTIRQALAQLRAIGLVVTRQGSGTFVSSYTQILEVANRRDESLDAGTWIGSHPTVGHVMEHYRGVQFVSEKDFELELGVDELIEVETGLEADGKLYAHCLYYMDASRFADIGCEWDNGLTMADHLRDKYHVVVNYSWRRFRAEACSERVATSLGIAVGDPLLVREGVSRDTGGKPLYYVVRRMVGDLVAYTVNYPAR